MDRCIFIDAIVADATDEDILNCNQLSDLHVERRYRVVILSDLIENIPVFDMNQIWERVKETVCAGGLIVIKTALYESPNVLAEDETDYHSIGCNKQTEGTLLRDCLKFDLIMADSENSYFAFIRKEDLSLYTPDLQKRFLSHHEKRLSKFGLEKKEIYDKNDFRKLVPGAGRLMLGLVAENNEKYQTQALRLVQSIRWFGGKMAGANIFVCMVDEANPKFVEELEKWGVFVRIVKRFSESHPPSNKLRLFELPEVDSYDTIMLLDCDTVFVQDPYHLINGEHFQAEMAAGATIPHNVFRNLFAHYRIPLPEQTYITSFSRQRTIWYCNAGVLIFPREILKSFYPVWKMYTIDLSQKKHLLGKHYFFCEQASLSIAFSAQPVPFSRLPLLMNFHLTGNMNYQWSHCDPVIIHYHKMNDKTGYLRNLAKKNSPVFRRINQYNQRLRSQCFKEENL